MFQVLVHVINSLGPVFMLVVLGVILRQSGFLSLEFFRGMNQLTFWFALPALLFVKIAIAQPPGGEVLKVTGLMVVCILIMTGVGYAVHGLMRAEAPSRGAFVQAVMRGNLAFVGVPVVFFAVDSDRLEQVALLSLGALVPVFNITALLVLMPGAGVRSARGHLPITIGKRIFSNPLVLACLAAAPFCLTGVGLPTLVVRGGQTLGQMALPLALLSIGASLSFARLKGRRQLAVLATILKVGLTPILGYFGARWLGLDAGLTLVVMIFCACPTAVTSYVMAEQMHGDEVLAGSTVVMTTLAAGLSLPIVIALFS